MSVLVGVTWVFGILLVIFDHIFLQFVFAILNVSQGALIFVIHIVRPNDIRLKWKALFFRRRRRPRKAAYKVSSQAVNISFENNSLELDPPRLSHENRSAENDSILVDSLGLNPPRLSHENRSAETDSVLVDSLGSYTPRLSHEYPPAETDSHSVDRYGLEQRHLQPEYNSFETDPIFFDDMAELV